MRSFLIDFSAKTSITGVVGELFSLFDTMCITIGCSTKKNLFFYDRVFSMSLKT